MDTIASHSCDTPAVRQNSLVYLLDDDRSHLKALARRLRAADFEVETFSSPQSFLNHPRTRVPACAVIDLQMPGVNGLEVQGTLQETDEPLPVIFLTALGDISTSVRAMKGGAVDFLIKPVRSEELIDAVNRGLRQDQENRRKRCVARCWQERYATLTPCERKVFALIVEGLPNKGIAHRTGVSERTVKAHRAEVMRKLEVSSPAELGRAVEWIGGAFEAPASME